MKIGIVGGGIAGLTAALALSRDGHDVACFEHHPGAADRGAGLVLARNAQSILEILGVDLAGCTAGFSAMETRDAAGRVVQSIGTLIADGQTPRCITRGDLHRRLLDAVPVSVVQTGQVTTTASMAARAQLLLDGTVHTFDLVVGADGLHSSTRATLGLGRLRSTGQTCWRWLGPLPTDLIPANTAAEYWAPGCRLGLVPLPGDKCYGYLVADAPAGAPAPATLEELGERFVACPPAATVIATLPGVPVLHHDLIELDRPVWGRGPTLLIGDAAHAMTPNLGQGAAMAIEDAAALALALRTSPVGIVDAVRRRRQARVRAMQLTSRRIGALSHMTSPIPTGLRDRALRAMPQRWGHAQYVSLLKPGLDLAREMRTPQD